MTVLVTCPNCRDALDVPAEFRGRSVKCATCQTVFAVPAAAGAEPPTARRAAPPDRPRDPDEARPRPASNGIVWFLLLGTALVCGALCLFCGGFASWAYHPPMTLHKSEEGRFQVELPAEPQPFTQTGEQGAVVKGVEARREMVDGRFFVKYYDLPKKQRDGDAALTDALKAEIASLAAGRETQRQVTTHAGFPAIDVQLEQGSPLMERITVLRIVLAGSRVYILGTQGQGQQPQFWYIQRFFLSFQPTEKAPPAPKPEA